jgi:hypothetical protein
MDATSSFDQVFDELEGAAPDLKACKIYFSAIVIESQLFHKQNLLSGALVNYYIVAVHRRDNAVHGGTTG